MISMGKLKNVGESPASVLFQAPRITHAATHDFSSSLGASGKVPES